MPNVGSRLKVLRERTGLSQTKMADLIGATQSSVNRYETSKSEAPYKILLWYADYFDVSIDYLFCRVDNPEGKLYNYKPEALKQWTEKHEEIRQFVEMCFEPDSSINRKLKETLVNMLMEGDG